MLAYEPRQVEYLAPIVVDAVQLKRYELRCSQKSAVASLSDTQWLSLLSGSIALHDDAREHKVGFAMLHRAADGDYLLVSRWYGGNMLKHEAFTLHSEQEQWNRESLKDTSIIACVWELVIVSFERDAWVRTAMSRDLDAGLKISAYMRSSFTGWA
jgi:hypothetical protein